MKLYVAEFCPKCELAISKLKEHGYVFDIIQNANEALAKGIKVAPCLVCNEHQYGLKDILKICKDGGHFE